MSGDTFKFADIPAPSTPDEKRIVELVRAVVRDEMSKHADVLIEAFTKAARTIRNAPFPRNPA